jgi:tripartite-type tricarboxylate transporter receptor subunit TctC
MTMTRMLAFVALSLTLNLQDSRAAAAQTYPERSVKFILPYGAGSGTDVTARLLADRLAARWGKPVVVENRPGGDGLVAISALLSANDTHTLLFVPAAIVAVHPYQHDKLPYDAARDLVPVVGINSVILSLSVSGAMPVSSLSEFIEFVRANPGKYNAAASTGAPDFLMAGFLKSKNLDMAKVPYRDIMQGPRDLAENRLQLLTSALAIVAPLMQTDRIKVLAVTSRSRAPSAPNVPTVSEAGYPELEMESVGGIFGPRGMPNGLRERIAEDVRAVTAADQDMAAKLSAIGQLVDVRGPADFEVSIKELNNKLSAIAQVLGVKSVR